MEGFIGLASRGRNEWWRYALSAILIAVFWMGIGSFALLVLIINGGPPFAWDGMEPAAGPLSGLDPFITFYLPVAFSFVSLAVSIVLAVRLIHARPVLSLVTAGRWLDWKRLRLGFLVFLAFNLLSNAVFYAMDPGAFAFTLDAGRLLLFAPLYIILTVVQTTSEELLFRGYLLQGLGNFLRRPLFAAVLSSLVFMLVHAGNPETANGFVLAMAYYFAVGLWLCMVTLRSGSSEIAIGAHAANNLFILLVNYDTSALEIVPSAFKMTSMGASGLALSLGLFITMGAGAYLVLFKNRNPKAA